MSALVYCVFHCPKGFPLDVHDPANGSSIADLNQGRFLKTAIQDIAFYRVNDYPDAPAYFIELFTNTPFKQAFMAIPQMLQTEDGETFKNQCKNLFRAPATSLFSADALQAVDAQQVTRLLVMDDNSLAKNTSETEVASRVLRNSGALKDAHFKTLDSLQYLMDGAGLAIRFKRQNFTSEGAIKRTENILILLMLANAYGLVLDQVTEQASLATKNQQLQQIDQTLEQISQFLLGYYFDLPVLHSRNETFHLYNIIKDRLCLQEQYQEAVEQMRLLSEIERIKANNQLQQWQTTQAERDKAQDKKFTVLALVIGGLQVVIAFATVFL